VLRRPGVSALLSLALIVTLITLSQFKYGITQLTLTFLDFLIIDRDTFSFLHSIFPQLKTQSWIFAAVAAPVMWVIWRADPFRIRRAISTAGAVSCVAAITGLSVIYPEQPWSRSRGVNHISNLARSGVVSVSHLTSTGWIEADPPDLIGSAQATPLAECEPGKKRPNIIMVLDESSFDISAAPGIRCLRTIAIISSLRMESSVRSWRVCGRADLVHRIQCADRTVGALVRQAQVLCDADRGGQDLARAAAGGIAAGIAPSRCIRPMATS
jgi:hypothetical protein